jgi:hypothetical protein
LAALVVKQQFPTFFPSAKPFDKTI